MESTTRRQDLLIGLAFALGLVLLVVPDTFFYCDPVHSPKYWLNLANTALDAVLFTTVFVFLKIEIRKRRAINDQLAAANRLKSEFLQIAAHDLRNPLSIISLATYQIPREKSDAPGVISDPAQEIRATAQEMLGIIDGLLDTAAMEEGTLKLNRQHHDLAACVAEVIERNLPLAQRKSQELHFSPRESCVVEIDAGRIKQAVDNLISNAIKFSPQGESIEVSLVCDGTQAQIDVVDHGPGLDEADKAHLFQRFARLSARPTGGESSTGLGLANARQLVELHGGELGGESSGLGQGSRFWIKLPAAL